MSCLKSLRSELKKLGHKVPPDLLEEMEREFQGYIDQGLTGAQYLAKMTEIIEKDMAAFAQKKRAVKLMQLARDESIRLGHLENKKLGLTDTEYARAVMEGGALKSGDGTNIDPMDIENSMMAQFLDVYGQLNEFKAEIESGKLDREIFQELDALQTGQKSGASQIESASRAAKIIKAAQDLAFEEKLRRNPMMRYTKDYFVEQSYSVEKVQAMSETEFTAFMLGAAGKKSFPDLSPKLKEDKFRAIYNEIISGKQSFSDAPTGNIAYNQARGREIRFNDWQKAYEAHKLFSEGTTVAETVLGSLSRAAREISQLEKFGPERAGFVDRLLKILEKNTDAKGKAQLKADEKYLRQVFETASGSANTPADGIASNLVQGGLSLLNSALNGRQVLTSIPDLAIQTSLLQDTTGGTTAELAREITSAVFKAMANPKQAQQAALQMGVYTYSYKAALARSMGTTVIEDTVVPRGVGDKALKKFTAGTRWLADKHGVITGANYVRSAHDSALATTLSHRLADLTNTSFKDLPIEIQKSITRYGLSQAWDVLKFAKQELDIMGRKQDFVTPGSVKALPDDAVENYLLKSGFDGKITSAVLDRARGEISVKIGAMINEHVRLGTSTSGTRQKQFMYRATSINDTFGKLARLFWQFKSAALVSTDIMKRRYYSGEAMTGNWAGVGKYAASLLFMGAVTEYALSTIEGKTPEDPRSLQFGARVLARSGVTGVWGDAFISEMSRQGVDNRMLALLSSAAGPLASKAVEGSALAFESLGAKKPPVGRAVKWGFGMVPFQNLFWAAPTLNYYFLNGIKDDLDHGFMRQMRKSMQKKDQEFMFPGDPVIE